MTRIFVPSSGPQNWQQLLAKPALHWAMGYSARTVAHSWEAAVGLPTEINTLLADTYGPVELLFATPEHKTPLPGGRRESQSDVFALVRHANGLVACTVEGKVDEPFGPTVAQQMVDASPGRIERLVFLCEKLGIASCPPDVHYQLLHRAVSALVEAERFHAADAAMIVHSFSPDRRWFEAFERFTGSFEAKATDPTRFIATVAGGRRLLLGWAAGNQRYREM